MRVSCSVEYSYEKLTQIELNPFSVDDYEIIEKNSGFIEE